jgi:hypothetical protein
VLGPTLPSESDVVLAREAAAEAEREQRDYKRKRDKLEAKERIEDMVGPREVGKEGMLEKKRARRDADKSFREKGDDGLEADETTLLGGGDSFKQQWVNLAFPIILLHDVFVTRIARRDAARKRYEHKSQEKMMATQERASQIREKEKVHVPQWLGIQNLRHGYRLPWICSSRWPKDSDDYIRFTWSSFFTSTYGSRLLFWRGLEAG